MAHPYVLTAKEGRSRENLFSGAVLIHAEPDVFTFSSFFTLSIRLKRASIAAMVTSSPAANLGVVWDVPAHRYPHLPQAIHVRLKSSKRSMSKYRRIVRSLVAPLPNIFCYFNNLRWSGTSAELIFENNMIFFTYPWLTKIAPKDNARNIIANQNESLYL